MPIRWHPGRADALITGTIVVSPAGIDGPHRIDPWASSRASPGARIRCLTGRRRLVDPTTCEREYAEAEQEFMRAMEEYKQASGRQFPTWCEVLEVLQRLGYEKPGPGASSASEPVLPRPAPGRDDDRERRNERG